MGRRRRRERRQTASSSHCIGNEGKVKDSIWVCMVHNTLPLHANQLSKYPDSPPAIEEALGAAYFDKVGGGVVAWADRHYLSQKHGLIHFTPSLYHAFS